MVAPALAIPKATQATAEQLELLKRDLGHWVTRLAHSGGLTRQEEYRGWLALAPMLLMAVNAFQQWRTDFSARWNGSPILNTLKLHGSKWVYKGFLVDGSEFPRAPGCYGFFGAAKGQYLQVNDTGNPIAHAKAAIDQWWDAVIAGETPNEAQSAAEATNAWHVG